MADLENAEISNFLKDPRLKMILKTVGTVLITTLVGIVAVSSGIHQLVVEIPNAEIKMPFHIAPATVLIGYGILLPFIVLFGALVSLNENLYQLRVLKFAVVALVGIGTIAGIYTVSSAVALKSHIADSIQESITKYHEGECFKDSINCLQKTLGCCGLNGVDDWNANAKFFCNDTNPSPEKCNVPSSCCIYDEDFIEKSDCGLNSFNMSMYQAFVERSQCGLNALNKTRYQELVKDGLIYHEGCLGYVTHIIATSSVGTLIPILLMQIILYYLFKKINKDVSCEKPVLEKNVLNREESDDLLINKWKCNCVL